MTLKIITSENTKGSVQKAGEMAIFFTFRLENNEGRFLICL